MTGLHGRNLEELHHAIQKSVNLKKLSKIVDRLWFKKTLYLTWILSKIYLFSPINELRSLCRKDNGTNDMLRQISSVVKKVSTFKHKN
jgi:hypothetical protein